MSTKSQVQLGRADHGIKVSRNEFAEAHFDEPWRYERVNGRLMVMSPSGQEHIDASEPFRDHFVAYKLSHPGTIANVVTEAWIAIDEKTDRIADQAVYLTSTRAKGDIPDIPPDIVVEAVSEGSLKRDYEDKREDYLRAGIREYLIVDRFQHRLTVHRRSRGRYTESTLGPEDSYTTPILPGLKIPLADLI